MVKTRGAAFAMLALLGACEINSTTIPLAEPEIVLHAVLNPTLSTQTLLIEESLTGKITADDKRQFDPANPIVTGNGVPVTGAIVQLTAPDGTILTASEVKSANQPTGIYRIASSVQPGGRYDLKITALGKTVTGSTLIPQATVAPITPTVVFNRDHETVKVPINAVDFARAYWIRIEAANSAFNLATVDRDVEIDGETRNLFTDDLLRVFFPGFQQTMTVAAMDTNLFDYYRSGNDPFSGVGLINHLTGGLGVFGSVAIIERRILDVTQDATGDSIEGTYTRRTGSASFPNSIRVYRESKGATSGSSDRISGNYLAGTGAAATRGAMVGFRDSTALNFRWFEPLSTSRSNGNFIGQVRNDTISGMAAFSTSTSSAQGAVLYVRQGK